MFRICFVDEDLTSFDIAEDLDSLSETFLLDLSLYIGKDLTVLDPNGDLVATCFAGLFCWC